MKHIYWSRSKLSRLLIIAGVLGLYVGLEIINALEMFDAGSTNSFSAFGVALSFGVFSLISLIFLAVGSLVWLYARERLVAHLLFAFSVAMMIVLNAVTNVNGDQFFYDLANVATLIVVFLVSLIVFYFPQNILYVSKKYIARNKKIFQVYLAISALFMVICSFAELHMFTMSDFKVPVNSDILIRLYYLVYFFVIVGALAFSYIKMKSGRKKQQMRIFVYGLIISLFFPFMLSVLPVDVNIPAYSVDGRYTALALVIFPLALGYSVLRYQLLVLDTYIQRVVSFIVGMIALAIFVYAEITCIDIFSNGNISILTVIFIGISIAIFASLIWRLSRGISDRLFFPETVRYKRLIQEPSLASEEILHVDDAARLITTAAISAFEVPQVCLLVLDETSTCYQFSPEFSKNELGSPCIALFRMLQPKIAPLSGNDTYRLDTHLPALQELLNSRRPVLLSEIILSKEERPRGLNRVMNVKTSLGQDDYLLAPLRSQGQMIGVLVLGERADGQPYAGPDFEIAQILTGRFSPVLESARLYEHVSKNYERQKELDALKEQFIMVASHELRTPLTIVQGYVELLCEHHDMLVPETQVEFLKKARVGCNELNLMVNNIVDANLIHVDVEKIHLHLIPLNKTVSHVLGMLDAFIQGEERSVVPSIAPELAVFADDLRLRQIFLNLISNALKYSTTGTRIEISAVQENMEAQIAIRDYGLGIPPDKQQQVFEPFTRLERDLNSAVRGSGLGLYICEQFVNAMGGRIWVESSGVPGEGCVFKFVLRCTPLGQAEQVEAVELSV